MQPCMIQSQGVHGIGAKGFYGFGLLGCIVLRIGAACMALMLSSLLTATVWSATADPPRRSEYRAGEIIIKLKAGAVSDSIRRRLAPGAGSSVSSHIGIDSLDALADRFGAVASKPVFRMGSEAAKRSIHLQEAKKKAYRGAGSPEDFDADLYRKILLPEDANILQVLDAYRRDPAVQYAEPNYIRKPIGEKGFSILKESGARSFGSAGSRSPAGTGGSIGHSPPALPSGASDPLFDQQWHLQAVNAPQAWEFLAQHGIDPGGSRDVVVAVVDTGVDYTHPDLAGNMWINSGEVAGNGIDDDQNGYVDDVYGANTTVNGGMESGSPMDDHGHGTHAAGIACAQGNNGAGGVGVAYNAQIMAIKAAQYSGVLTTSDIAEGILYAVDKGADVINMSFGSYARSQLEEDALAIAFGQCVLVAAAGNDGIPNEKKCDLARAKPMYPASHPWILGIMASTQAPNGQGDYLAFFSNWDCTAKNSIEYELMAPGKDIWSTLPAAQYAAWSGTSMATPVVSGMAALLRSYFADKDTYSSRFIMGQIAPTGAFMQGKTPGPGADPISFHMADAFAALSTTPKPSLSYLDHWTFDPKTLSQSNDEDGRLDAGETIDLAMTIRNHWGKADNVQVTIRAWNGVSSGDDPYVTMDIPTVDYGAVGSFNIDDNGLIYDENKEILGVQHPFRITISPECPNDHVIPVHVTMTCTNGYNPSEPPYTFESKFFLTVQRGVELPRFIDQDMTLTRDNYYIIPDATLIKAGVTVVAQPGAQIQFWSSNPTDPYSTPPDAKLLVQGKLLVRGTADDPVKMIPSPLHPDRFVKIGGSSGGVVDLQYARVTNPNISGASIVDHCYFDQDSLKLFDWASGNNSFLRCPECLVVKADSISGTIFHNLGEEITSSGAGIPDITLGTVNNTLFDSSVFDIFSTSFYGNVLLKNSKLFKSLWGDRAYGRSNIFEWGLKIFTDSNLRAVFPYVMNDKTYFLVANPIAPPCQGDECTQKPFLLTKEFAEQFGGHIACISSEEENNLVFSYLKEERSQAAFQARYPYLSWWKYSGYPIIGLTDWREAGVFEWVSGEPPNYVNWQLSEPGNVGNKGALTYFSQQATWGDGTWSYQTWSFDSHPFLLEVPGAWTQEAIDEKQEEIVLDLGRSINGMKNNAILNCWQDPDPAHWLSVQTFPTDSIASSVYRFINGNYWATTSTTLIDAGIRDFNDDMYRARVIYEPILTEPPEDCYPFVTDVILSTAAAPDVTKVGAEPVTFTVTFNRDMDMTVQPAVSFGPDMPETDYTIHPVDGGWVDPRMWQGTFKISPITGDGYQFIRVAGARAADDPWLVTGDDSERFRFEIITSGTESMLLQAVGGEGRVDLSWFQDDFDLLAGFNLYRSSSQDGSYIRINPNIIPKSQLSYVDTDIEPGKTYFYKFTVVKTDMTESSYSNVASATPLDTIAPVIQHTPITIAQPRMILQVHADITDNIAVQGATLFYRKQGQGSFTSLPMSNTSGTRFSGSIPGSSVVFPGVEYFLTATDGVSTTYSGSSAAPHPVTVDDRPTLTAVTPNHGSFAGGTLVTVSGANLLEGCTVSFGGYFATDVTVVSSNQVTCVTPGHFPAVVDVTVTNPGGAASTLFRAFTYDSSGATLEMPAVTGGAGAHVLVPVKVGSVSGLASAELTVTFDAAVLSAQSVTTGSFGSNFSLAANTATPGQIALAMSTGVPATGSGELALIDFLVTGQPGSSSALAFGNVSLNAGSIVADLISGAVQVDMAYQISGRCAYYANGNPVPGVALSLGGAGSYTCTSADSGEYAFTNIPGGSYTSTPSKSDGDNGAISALDASLVLQSVVGLTSFSSHQTIAGDVDHSGSISAMDASYILQEVVGLINLPFPGSQEIWSFDPSRRNYDELSSNQGWQDFTAVLIGDTTGDWNSTAMHRSSGSEAAFSIEPGSVNKAAASLKSLSHHGKARIKPGRAVPGKDGLYTVSIRMDVIKGALLAGSLILEYPTERFEAVSVGKSALGADCLISSNLGQSGKVALALASAVPITGSGEILSVTLRSKGADTKPPRIVIRKASLNDGKMKIVR